MAIAGIDVGTTGCKCTIYEKNGTFVRESYQEYNIEKDGGGHELNAWNVWLAVKQVLKEALQGTSQVDAIGVTSFGETSIFVGRDGKPLMNSLLYTDPRGEDQCRELVEHFGRDAISKRTGANPQSMYSISKLMWVVQNRKDVYERTEHICQFGDYIVFMLSGTAQIDYSLACRSMAFQVDRKEWDSEILSYAGIDPAKMSKPVPTGSSAGRIRKELAEELRIDPRAMIVSGCHDQVAAAIGTGCLRQGMAVDGTGTVECITPVFGELSDTRELYQYNYVKVPYVCPGSYVTYAFSFNGGSLLKWYRDQIARHEAKLYQEQGLNVYDSFNKQMNTGNPSGLLILPYFSGSATPYMDVNAVGAIVGLRDTTTSIDIYQGLMEGVTYEMLFNLELLEKAGIQVTELRATGGGARAEAWLQMKADILNKRIITLGEAQSGTLGCIMLAGTACGLYGSLEEAAEIFVKPGKEYTPNQERHQEYQEYYRKYKKMYEAISTIINA